MAWMQRAPHRSSFLRFADRVKRAVVVVRCWHVLQHRLASISARLQTSVEKNSGYAATRRGADGAGGRAAAAKGGCGCR